MTVSRIFLSGAFFGGAACTEVETLSASLKLKSSTAASRYPGNELGRTAQNTIEKKYGIDLAPLKYEKALRHYFVEKEVLLELERHKHVCDISRDHFPRLVSNDDKHLVLEQQYMGQTLNRYSTNRQFNDHTSCCLTQFSTADFRRQYVFSFQDYYFYIFTNSITTRINTNKRSQRLFFSFSLLNVSFSLNLFDFKNF